MLGEVPYLDNAQGNDKLVLWLVPSCFSGYSVIVVRKTASGIIAEFPPLARFTGW